VEMTTFGRGQSWYLFCPLKMGNIVLTSS
jgi:hypothetical protein